MKNNNIKLIATDMDGTFLNDQHQYDQDLLRKVLASCKEKGIYFAAASGRALLSLKSLWNPHLMQTPINCFWREKKEAMS